MSFSGLRRVCLYVWLSLAFSILINGAKWTTHDAGFVPDYTLRVSVEYIFLNCQMRLSTLVNGSYPGPPIYLEPEQTTWIRVYNDAEVNTTMHWHGLSVSSAPFADGSPQASQWPIPPGSFFDYELHPTADQAGTSFYHSHVGFQAVTAAGPLIVKDAAPLPYVYDDDVLLQIGDFYLLDDLTIESQLTGIPWIWPGDPTALQINGQSGTGPTAQNTQTSDESCLPYVINVLPATTYRVRTIGATAISLVLFGIEDHDSLTIIETDNSYVYPVQTAYMQVDSGQRFSFLLRTKSVVELEALDKFSFWIQFETRSGEHTVCAWAILNYVNETNLTDLTRREVVSTWPQGQTHQSSASSAAKRQSSALIPTSPVLQLPTNVTDWKEYRFINPPFAGYDTPPNSSEITRRVIITTLQHVDPSSGHTMMILNNESWFDAAPLGPTTDTPYLVEILQNGTINGVPPSLDGAQANNATPSFDPISHTYPARIGEVLEIVWQNAASYPGGIEGPHPLHAHGGPYWDMGSGPGRYTPEAHAAMLQAHAANGSGMPYPGSRRDTTLLYKYQSGPSTPGEVNGWRVWRVRVTERNVGVWMMHCHILQHVVMGQQTVWVFGTPQEITAHCQPVNGTLDGYFTYGGDVVGITSQEDNGVDVVQFFDPV